MARYVTVEVGCDWDDCTTRAPEGTEIIDDLTVALDGKPGKTVQLCKEHREQLLDEILLPLLQRGIKAEAPRKAPTPRSRRSGGEPSPESSGDNHDQAADPIPCEEDGCGRKLKNTTGMAQHVIRSHGYEDLAAYEAVHGHIRAVA